MRQQNMDRFRDALLTEVIPQVEKAYRVFDGPRLARDRRPVHGRRESLYIGLNALDRFAWIGAFSSGGLRDDSRRLSRLDAKANDSSACSGSPAAPRTA